MASSKKLFSCTFWVDVVCSHRKSDKSGIMGRCLKCEHYARFIREMEKEDEEMDKEVEEAFANPEKYLRGQDDDRR
jgi:predicted ATP-dependent serine protease